MSGEGREGGGSGVGGCGSNMIIGQEGSVAVCRGAGGRGIILGVGDRRLGDGRVGWAAVGWWRAVSIPTEWVECVWQCGCAGVCLWGRQLLCVWCRSLVKTEREYVMLKK